ncbi:hypothetical protein [Chengkuizengella axinellae]|uniref:DNA-packaging protein n=1 Tax=Chengkuizengella axinellae TaxID=3064388 RepID=A0ABT9J6R7_9BACL|nr:hypothetical protein [Chengkuizengella sp. 2205SS18-9]MDP5277157.1 hypothetical protein [Chengkuizengella sp. 2205SS18-9]
MSDKGKRQKNIEVSTKEICEILGLSARRIQQLANEGILIRVSHGKYDLPASIQSYISYIKEQEMEEAELDKTEEEAKWTKARREKTELELQIMRGELHRSSDIQRVMNDMLGAFRARTLSIPSKAAPRIIGQTDLAVIQDVLKKEVHETLSELSEYDAEVFYSQSSDALVIKET